MALIGHEAPFEHDPCSKPCSGSLIPRIALLSQHHEHPQRVVQSDVLKLGRRRIDQQDVLGQ